MQLDNRVCKEIHPFTLEVQETNLIIESRPDHWIIYDKDSGKGRSYDTLEHWLRIHGIDADIAAGAIFEVAMKYCDIVAAKPIGSPVVGTYEVGGGERHND